MKTTSPVAILLALVLVALNCRAARAAQVTYEPDPYVQARLQVSRDNVTWQETDIVASVGQVLYCRPIDPSSGLYPPPTDDWDTRVEGDNRTLAEDLDMSYQFDYNWDGNTDHFTASTGALSYSQPGTYRLGLRADDVPPMPADDPAAYDSLMVKVIGGPIHADGPCDKRLVLSNPAGDSIVDSFSAAAGQPNGTTYQWSIDQGADKAEIVGATVNASCQVRAKAASGAANDVRIKLVYTNAGLSYTAYLTTTVQRPTTLGRVDLGYVIQQCVPVVSVARQFLDTVRDQLGQPVPYAFLDESWDVAMQEGDTFTDCNGQAVDTWANGFGGICDQRGLWLDGRQTVQVSGWGCFLKYHRQDWDGVPPTIVGANVGCP